MATGYRRREIKGAGITWKPPALCEVQDDFKLERVLPGIRSSSRLFDVPVRQGWGSGLSSALFLPILPRLGGALQDLICGPAGEGFLPAVCKDLSSLDSSR